MWGPKTWKEVTVKLPQGVTQNFFVCVGGGRNTAGGLGCYPPRAGQMLRGIRTTFMTFATVLIH